VSAGGNSQGAGAGPAAGRDELAAALRTPYRSLLGAVALSLVIGVLLLAPAAYMFEVYGRVINSRSEATLGWLLLAAVGLYAMLELLELVRLRVLRAAGNRVHDRLARRVFEAGFAARLAGRPGAGGQGVADLRTVTDALASPAVTAMLDMPAALLMLALLYAMGFWIGVLGTVLLLALVAVGLVQERLSARPYAEALRSSSEAQLRAAETLRNAQVVESMAMAPALQRRWDASQARSLFRLAQASERAAGSLAAMRTVQLLQGSLLLGLAVWLAIGGELPGGPGMAIVASILGGRALTPIAQLVGQWRAVGAVRVAHARLVELLQLNPAEKPGIELPPPSQKLLAEDIVVHAPGTGVPLLHRVRLGCAAGQMVAVIGPTGCGKSTLARALVGLWPSQGGKVRLDGADVGSWHKSQLGRWIGYVPQRPELFDATVAENIARFGRVDDESLARAIDDAGVGPLIDSLPEGVHTRLGAGGVQLSGGEQQRIALARAIYGDVRLVVLDEPNASLDQAGDRALEAMIRRLKARGAIVVVVTHRKQVLALAEYVMLMQAGATARFGPRDEVLAALAAPPSTGAGGATAAPAASRPAASPGPAGAVSPVAAQPAATLGAGKP
jgi:ATP-binding cassette subfamily C exporter for protease/lipase